MIPAFVIKADECRRGLEFRNFLDQEGRVDQKSSLSVA